MSSSVHNIDKIRCYDRYLPHQVEKELLVIRDDYRANELRFCDTLDWNGPLLYPECAADLSCTENAFRRPISSLLSESSPRYSAPGTWKLELRSPLAVGDYTERCAQVWSCDLLGGSDEVQGRVVVKFYFKGWYTHTNVLYGKRDGKWMSEEGVAMTEARAYERFKPIQGSQVPFCYGVYEFTLPGGFKVKGMVLEDLTGSMRSVGEQYRLTKPDQGDKVIYDKWVDSLLVGMFSSFSVIHKYSVRPGIGNIFPEDIFVSKKFPIVGLNPQHVAFVGFGFSYNLEEWDKLEESLGDELEGSLAVKQRDCASLIDNLAKTLKGGIAYRWQHFMHSGGHTILGDPDIVFEDPSDTDYLPHHDGEFDGLHDS